MRVKAKIKLKNSQLYKLKSAAKKGMKQHYK